MANVLSKIVKAVTSADSLRVRTQQLRGSLLETVCDLRAWNADGTAVVATPLTVANNDAFLLCPIKLHDRISSMWTSVAVQGTDLANYSLALYGIDMANGPTLITTFGPAPLISRLVSSTIALPFGVSSTTFGLGDGTIWQAMTAAQRTAIKESKFKNDSSFILGLKPAANETAVSGLIVALLTVEGAPSEQDRSITV